MIYANNAGTSWPKPAVVHEATRATLVASPAEGVAIWRSAQDEVARFLDLPDPERFRFMPGCTSALALAIGDLPWAAGDEIVTSALEHHALARPVADLVRHRGVRHEVSPYREGMPIDLSFVRARLAAGRVRLVASSAASNVTGELLPVHELAELAHAHGALYLMDAAQTVGIVPLSVARSGADIVVFAGHKGPLGPQGIGGFWAGANVQFESPRATCEVGADLSSTERCDVFPSDCELGSVNFAGAAGVAAGMRWLSESADEPGAKGRRLARQLAQSLRGLSGCHVFGGDDVERTGALSLRIDGLPLERSEAYFAEQGIVVRAGQHCAPMALEAIGAPAGTIRISFGPFNTEGEVEEIARAVDRARR
jgi:selenocysteine lyase/cysteine desulfurase